MGQGRQHGVVLLFVVVITHTSSHPLRGGDFLNNFPKNAFVQEESQEESFDASTVEEEGTEAEEIDFGSQSPVVESASEPPAVILSHLQTQKTDYNKKQPDQDTLASDKKNTKKKQNGGGDPKDASGWEKDDPLGGDDNTSDDSNPLYLSAAPFEFRNNYTGTYDHPYRHLQSHRVRPGGPMDGEEYDLLNKLKIDDPELQNEVVKQAYAAATVTTRAGGIVPHEGVDPVDDPPPRATEVETAVEDKEKIVVEEAETMASRTVPIVAPILPPMNSIDPDLVPPDMLDWAFTYLLPPSSGSSAAAGGSGGGTVSSGSGGGDPAGSGSGSGSSGGAGGSSGGGSSGGSGGGSGGAGGESGSGSGSGGLPGLEGSDLGGPIGNPYTSDGAPASDQSQPWVIWPEVVLPNGCTQTANSHDWHDCIENMASLIQTKMKADLTRPCTFEGGKDSGKDCAFRDLATGRLLGYANGWKHATDQLIKTYMDAYTLGYLEAYNTAFSEGQQRFLGEVASGAGTGDSVQMDPDRTEPIAGLPNTPHSGGGNGPVAVDEEKGSHDERVAAEQDKEKRDAEEKDKKEEEDLKEDPDAKQADQKRKACEENKKNRENERRNAAAGGEATSLQDRDKQKEEDEDDCNIDDSSTFDR